MTSSLVARLLKNPPAVQETPCLIPGSGRSPGEGVGSPLQGSWASLVVQLVKHPLAMWETWVRSLGWEDPLEEGNPLQYSCLENPHGQRSLAGYSPWSGKSWTQLTKRRTAQSLSNTVKGTEALQAGGTFTPPIGMFQRILNGIWRARGGLRLACKLISQSPYNQENGTAGDAMSILPGRKVVCRTLGCFWKMLIEFGRVSGTTQTGSCHHQGQDCFPQWLYWWL